MIYNDYELLRDFVESALNNLDPQSWESILILDDYSKTNTKLREYENYLEQDDRFNIISFSEHRLMRHYMAGSDSVDNEEKNLGHGAGFNMGISKVGTEFMLYLDVDCIFLRKSKEMLNEMSEMFDKHPDVMAAGQLFGVNGRAIYEGRFKFFHGPADRDSTAGGFLGPSSGAFRMSGWNEKELPLLSTDRLPNLLTRFSSEVFLSGFKIGSYPWFTEMRILHLGRGIVRRYSEEQRGIPEPDWFVFCKDFHGQHGPRFGLEDLRSNHYGRGFINMTSREYRNYLKERGEKPFEEINPAIDEGAFVYTVD